MSPSPGVSSLSELTPDFLPRRQRLQVVKRCLNIVDNEAMTTEPPQRLFFVRMLCLLAVILDRIPRQKYKNASLFAIRRAGATLSGADDADAYPFPLSPFLTALTLRLGGSCAKNDALLSHAISRAFGYIFKKMKISSRFRLT